MLLQFSIFLALATNSVQDSEQSLEQIMQSHPCDPAGLQGLHKIAKQWAMERENYDRAEILYHKLLECEPKNTEYLYELGALLAKQKRFREAQKLLNKALKIDPNFFLATVELGHIDMWKGDPDSAFDLYKKALQIEPCNQEVTGHILFLANEWRKEGNYRKAALAYKSILSCDDDGIIHYQIGKLYAKNDEFTKAINAFDQAAKNPKYNQELLIELGKNYYYKGENTLASQYLLESLIKDPCNEEAMRTLNWVGRNLMKNQEFERAREVYEALEMCDPTDGNFTKMRTKALAAMGKEEDLFQIKELAKMVNKKFAKAQQEIYLGNLEEAKAIFDNYLLEHPCDEGALDGLEEIALEYEEDSKKHEEALELWFELLGCRPDSVKALLHIGKLYMWQGELDQAEKYMNRALEKDPDAPLVDLYLSNVYIAQGRFEEATEIIEKYPDEHHANVNRGLIHYKKKEYRRAEKVFREILENTKGDRDTRLWYGRTLARQTRYDEAKKQYTLALMGFPENEILWRELWNTQYFTNPMLLYDIHYVEAKENDPQLEQPVVKNYYFNENFELYLPITNRIRMDLSASTGFEKENDIFPPLGHNYKVDVSQFRMTERYRLSDEWNLNFFQNIRVGDGLQSGVNFPFQNRLIFEPGGNLAYAGEKTRFGAAVFYDSFVTKNFSLGKAVFIKTKNVDVNFSQEFTFHPIRPRIRGAAANRYYQDDLNNKRRSYNIWVVVGPPNYTDMIDIYYHFTWRAFDKLTTNYWTYLRQYLHRVGLDFHHTWNYSTFFNFRYEYEWQQTHQQLRPIGNFLFISPLQKLQGQRVEALISRRLGNTCLAEISGSYFRSTLVYRAYSIRAKLNWQF